MLSAQIKCTLPLIELMKIYPELWEGLTEKLVEHGVLKRGQFNQSGQAKVLLHEPVELNKVGETLTKHEGNTTFSIVHEGVRSLAIQDSGVGISIATRSIWEKWGKP